MTFFHVIKVHSIDECSGGWRADLPDGTAESVAGAERGDGKALTLSCVPTELCVPPTETETHLEGGLAVNTSAC